ncbi:MAG: DUF4910 domain-containing protein, partial [Nitrospirota bacterium]|nr:DUF4910 domain-containing protein [Nitrospirota bacterium]
MTDETSIQVGQEMHRFIADLYPICRSITGDGVRDTLQLIGKHIPLEIHEVPSGTKVFDWTVPKEWNIRDAYIKNSKGERVVDFKKSNLHVVSYSQPIDTKMTLGALKPYLHTLPEFPEWIPYRTSYYKESWGFCLTHKQFQAFQDEQYEVCIQSSLKNGSLTYGECVIPGDTPEEVLISAHVCHPSLCNDNLSGIALATYLALKLKLEKSRYTYRFLFVPGTIGSIVWLAQNQKTTDRIRHGMVLTGVGDG